MGAAWPAPPSVHLHVARNEQQDGTVVLTLLGELDLESGAMLASMLRAPENGDAVRVVLDLAGVEFIDSTGISVLVRARQQARDADRQFVLTNLPESVERIFGLTGIRSHFTIA